jgi:hypothetical protein
VTGTSGDPFAALGLAPGADLTDDDVRVAWRRVAAVTHPDRPDGGDPERFAIAAAAYSDLRTAYGRGEARASVAQASRQASMARPLALSRVTLNIADFVAQVAVAVRRGRPVRLAMRVTAAASAATFGVIASGPGPAGPALATGAATWLVLTARHDLGRREGTSSQPGSGPTATGRAGSADHADQEPT